MMDHQRDALEAVAAGLERYDRGQLIIACGTSKTRAALHIAEWTVSKGRMVEVHTSVDSFHGHLAACALKGSAGRTAQMQLKEDE